MRFRHLLLLCGLCLAPLARAAPAPWYLWVSKPTGARICAQVPPGPAWTRLRGPFRDQRCEHPGRPG